jgi:uncharacterized membrane protein/sporulation protein YlmC with PRC-barrel domain
MIDIPLHAKVECVNGPCGESTDVIVNPVNRKVTHFVVRDMKFPDSGDRLVPIDRVEKTSHDSIRLNCTKDELGEMDPFTATRYVEKQMPQYPSSYYGGEPGIYMEPYVISTELIPVDIERVPPGELAIHRGAGVEASDGWVGRVDEFLVDPDSGEVTHLVDDTVYLKIDKQTIESLPTIPVRRSFGWEDAEIELVVLVFDEPGKAEEALEFLKELKRERNIIAIRNSAVLVKDEDGQVSLKEAQDVDARHGRLFGAITGGLVGLAAGPVGVVVGAAAGAVVGGAAADHIDMGFSNKYLKDLEKHLQPGSSALIALVENEWVGEVADAMAHFGGQLFRQALTDEIIAAGTAGAESDGTGTG